MKYPQACIVLFARAPVAGQVKTRLIPALGAEAACALHLRLLQQIIARLNASTLCPAELWTDQQPWHPAFGRFEGSIQLQPEGDLGARLSAAARRVLSRYEQALFIGTDCPALDEDYLAAALAALQNCDVVLGPATDGGYVLLGIRQHHAGLFTDIEWGSSAVLQQTLGAARQLGLGVQLLSELADIDRPEDLHLLDAVDKQGA